MRDSDGNRWLRLKVVWASGDTDEISILVDEPTNAIYIQGVAMIVSADVDTLTLTESISNA